jgi:hypothetical protein
LHIVGADNFDTYLSEDKNIVVLGNIHLDFRSFKARHKIEHSQPSLLFAKIEFWDLSYFKYLLLKPTTCLLQNFCKLDFDMIWQ